MKLEDLARFTVSELHEPDASDITTIVGHLSHLQGVRGLRGFLYRPHGPSLLGDLEAIPSTAAEPVRFLTADARYAPDLKVGAILFLAGWLLEALSSPRWFSLLLSGGNPGASRRRPCVSSSTME